MVVSYIVERKQNFEEFQSFVLIQNENDQLIVMIATLSHLNMMCSTYRATDVDAIDTSRDIREHHGTQAFTS